MRLTDMANAKTTQPLPDIPEFRPAGKKENPVKIFLLFIVFFSASYFLFAATRTSRKTSMPPSLSPVIKSGSPVKTQPSSSAASGALPEISEETLIQQIGDTTLSKLVAEHAAVSPADHNLAAFFGPDENWSRYGLYLYDIAAGKAKPIYEVQESITGRGGYYMDNSALEFSPSGAYVSMNRTGINFPSFIVADIEGNILKNSGKFEDMGHPTWVKGNELLYLKTDTIYVFDAVKKTSVPTDLPKHIFHLRANPEGTRVAAYAQTANKLDCESFDLHIYSYPEGVELKTESNTQIGAKWITNDSLEFKKVTGCTKNAEESMFPYSPETEEQTLVIQ